MTKRVLKPILISLIQIVGLAIIHDVLYYFYPMHHKSIGFGLTIRYTGLIFTILILAFNYYLEFRKNKTYLIGAILFIFTSVLPIISFDFRPWRSLLLIILAFSGYISSLIISNWKIGTRIIKLSSET